MGSVTGDCESCKNEMSARTTCVNSVDFALGLGGDLHSPMARANHPPNPVQNQPHLYDLRVQISFNFFYNFPQIVLPDDLQEFNVAHESY